MTKNRGFSRAATAGLVGFAFALTSLPVQSQTSGQQAKPPAQTSPAPKIEIKEHELTSFASAVAALQQIKQSDSQEIGQAGSKKKAQEIQGEMQEEMRQAIQSEGLSVQRYTKIGQAVQGDPELRQKVNKLVQEQ